MPESSPDGWVLSDAALQKVIKAVRQTLAFPRNTANVGGGRQAFGPLNIKSATNNTGETLPTHSLVAFSTVAPSAFVVGDELIQMGPTALKPSTTYTKGYGVVVGESVANGETALVSLSGAPVTYQGTVPVIGQSVGPVANSFAVSTTGAPYFTVVGVSTAFQLVDVVPYQPATISPVTLGTSVASDGTATVTLSDGRSVTAQNKSGQILEAGPALCLADPHTGMHYITGSAKPSTSGGGGGLSSSDLPAFYYGTLSQVLRRTDSEAAVGDLLHFQDGTPNASTAIDNLYGWWGAVGDGVFVMETGLTPTGLALVAMTPRVARTFRAALVSGALSSTSLTATVENILALDGGPPPTTALTLVVQNPLGWSGAGGDYCRIIEDFSTGVNYVLEHVKMARRQVVVASTWNSTSLVHNYIDVPLPAPDATGTTVVFATTQATAVQSVTTTGINLVRLDRPLTVFAAGASTQVTIATGTTCS